MKLTSMKHLLLAGAAVAAFVNVRPDGPTPVPERSTWAMMSIGFVLLSFAGYRTSRQTAVVA